MMCGRFAFFGNGFFGYESLQLPDPPIIESYNITPSQNILAIRSDHESGQTEWTLFRWGLLPFWSKTAKPKFPLINARMEGIELKPSFRGPFKSRRCIIPASGFYEWVQEQGGKQPWFIRPVGYDYFSFAGIWDHWQGQDGRVIETCSIVTTEANDLMRNIHDRMPVIFSGEEPVRAWLDHGTGKNTLLSMLTPCISEEMIAYPVSTYVNNPRNNAPVCIERIQLL